MRISQLYLQFGSPVFTAVLYGRQITGNIKYIKCYPEVILLTKNSLNADQNINVFLLFVL